MKTVPEQSPSTEGKKRFYIKTFGCQMNVADTERMTALLAEQGMEPADQPQGADVILINGCTVREKAVHKAVSFLGGMKSFKTTNSQSISHPIIGIGGC